MKYFMAILISFVLSGCGKPYSEQHRIEQVACAELRKAKEDDALQRLKIVNSAREELEEDAFIGDDSEILRYQRWGVCEQFILNNGNYSEEASRREQAFSSLRKRTHIAFEFFTYDGVHLVKVDDIYLDTRTMTGASGHASGWMRRKIGLRGNVIEYQAEFHVNNGKVEGLVRSWHDNGQLLEEGNYKNNKLSGISQRWHENGQLSHKANFKNDKLEGVYRKWYENGQLSRQNNYKNGKQEGLTRLWHENGKKASEVNYKNDKREGVIRRWHENGQLALEGNYKQGKAEGAFRRWHKNGKVITLSELQNNKSQ